MVTWLKVEKLRLVMVVVIGLCHHCLGQAPLIPFTKIPPTCQPNATHEVIARCSVALTLESFVSKLNFSDFCTNVVVSGTRLTPPWIRVSPSRRPRARRCTTWPVTSRRKPVTRCSWQRATPSPWVSHQTSSREILLKDMNNEEPNKGGLRSWPLSAQDWELFRALERRQIKKLTDFQQSSHPRDYKTAVPAWCESALYQDFIGISLGFKLCKVFPHYLIENVLGFCSNFVGFWYK